MNTKELTQMSDAEMGRRWPERVWLAQIKGVVGALHIVPDESLRSEPSIETEPYVPEAALAKARKEGREELVQVLLGEDGLARLQCALSEDGWMLSAHPCYDDAEQDRLKALLRREITALDSLTKEGDCGA